MNVKGVAYLLFLPVFVSGAWCSHGQNSVKTGEWVDGDTFRIEQVGAPRAGLKTKQERQESARQSAIAQAQKRIVEIFMAAGPIKNQDDALREKRWNDSSSEMRKSAAGGTIINIIYDDVDYCEIVYELKRKDLRKKVVNGTW
jgi:hypothetical protein